MEWKKETENAVEEMELKWKREMEERDAKLIEELKNRDMTFWEETSKNAESLCKMLERRDQEMMAALQNIDKLWLGSLEHYKQSYRMMTYEHINNRTTLESISIRQCELVKSNVEILDWAMKTVSGKKKVPLPNTQISDYVPYTIVSLSVDKPDIPFTHPNKPEETPPTKSPKPVSESLDKPSCKSSQDPKENKKK